MNPFKEYYKAFSTDPVWEKVFLVLFLVTVSFVVGSALYFADSYKQDNQRQQKCVQMCKLMDFLCESLKDKGMECNSDCICIDGTLFREKSTQKNGRQGGDK